MTIGGRSVVKRYERVRASRNVRGPSVSNENEGIIGRYSTMSWPNMYNNGNLGEVTKEGVKRSQGAAAASPPYTTTSVVIASLTNEDGRALPVYDARTAWRIWRNMRQRRNTARVSIVVTSIPNHAKTGKFSSKVS